MSVGAFAAAGIDAGEAVMVAVPEPRLALLRSALGDGAAAVHWLDMTRLGRNPARIISAIADFVDSTEGRPARMVGEPIWPGRTDAEMLEAARHEALINLAFAGVDVRILCPYDAALPAQALALSACTHPLLEDATATVASRGYDAQALADSVGIEPLAPPPAQAATLPDAADLCTVRGFLRGHLHHHDLTAGRGDDLVTAANEVVGNSIRHADAPASVRLWAEDERVVCEVAGGGRIADALAGRLRPAPTERGGRGLWLVNQLCDLSQLRTGTSGTTVRMQMLLGT